MPLRPFEREQAWLLPPTLDELIAANHVARFVAVFVDALESAAWTELDIMPDGELLGAPAYHPRALLSVWLYGFMTGVRSTRKLEAACRDQAPYWWLTGRQQPDHNTLWRFYEENRDGLRHLLRRTVRTAVMAGLVDLAVQAVDGTKVAGNAAKDRTYDEAGLQRLLERTEAAIADLEAQNKSGDEPLPPRLPERLADAKVLEEQVKDALARVQAEDGPRHTNLTDSDAGLLKSRGGGFIAGYNAQAMASPLNEAVAGRTGMLITAAAVTNSPDDHPQLGHMVEQAQGLKGKATELTLADAGYHSGTNLESMEALGQKILMPEAGDRARRSPYHKDAFIYDSATDSYRCPEGQTLHFKGEKNRRNRPLARVYGAGPAVCRVCPAFGVCTKDRRKGRQLEIGPVDEALRRHRAVMAREESKKAYRQRQQLIEPVFGIMKEQQGARRFLLRGAEKVLSEWTLLATAFNLRTLYRVWASQAVETPSFCPSMAA